MKPAMTASAMEDSETDVKYTVRFYVDEKVTTELLGRKLDEFFFNGYGDAAMPDATRVGIRKIREYHLFQEQLYEMDYVVSYADRSSRIDFLIGQLCRNWCTGENSTLTQIPCWLIPSKNERFNHAVRKTAKNVKLNEFAFGTLPSMCTFSQHYAFRCLYQSEIIASFFYPQKYFAVHFAVSHKENCEEKRTFKFEVKFDMISRLIVYNSSHANDAELFFYLAHPALIYVEAEVGSEPEKDQIVSTTLTEYVIAAKWERTLSVGCKCNHTFCHIGRIGRAPVLKLVIPDKYQACRVVDQLAQKCGDRIEICYGIIQTVAVKTLLTEELGRFHYLPRVIRGNGRYKKQQSSVPFEKFDCQYTWEAIFAFSWTVRDQVALKQRNDGIVNYSSTLQSKVLKYAERDSAALTSALTHIFHMLNKNCIFDFEKALDNLFSHCVQNKEEPELPPGMCLVRRTVITPSRKILLTPTEHFDNRVMREVGAEHMLRLSFQDDDFSKLTRAVQFNSQKEEFIQEVVGKVLMNGIKIGNRHYEMLASSNSQLREHGMWMYAVDHEGRRASTIRMWLGDFSHLPNVAKYMARMGQCFSTSDSAVQITLKKSDEIFMKDVKSKDGRYVFSDGIGMISSDLAQEVRKSLNSWSDEEVVKDLVYEPSAFQIRYKGVKGMVVENPRLSGRKIGIRPSMKKFDCENSSALEIVKISAPRKLFLNKPLISIMEQLGVSEKSFLDLQMDMIFELTDSLLYEDKTVSTLQNNVNLNIPFSKLGETGFSFTRDPFFRSLLLGIYKQSIEMLKKKIRIAVPPQFGRNMLGVLDETKTLKYGEVFVQYSQSLGEFASPLKVHTGDVLVTKNPCMHPGDVRKFQAVDVEALHHIKDCIVFPARGRRPHPDEMAGSDLDGDEYVVIWKRDLIFSRANVKPMDYEAQQEKKTDGEIGVPEMVNFFCEYIMNDQIGIFANAHLAWADLHPEGIFSGKCMQIAHVYPNVLDFAKTGYSAEPGSIHRPYRFPDFMEKGSYNDSYRSEKVLGSLYRINRHLQACSDRADISDKGLVFVCDPDFEYSGWQKYEDWANEMKKEYVKNVEAVLNRCGARSVTAALTGTLRGNMYDRNRYDYEEMKCILSMYFRHIMSKIKGKFLNAVESEYVNSDHTEQEKMTSKYQRASALYMVVYQKKEANAIGLPWSVSDVLVQMKQEKLKSKCVEVSHSRCSLVQDGDSTIEKLFYGDFSVENQFQCLTLDIPSCRCINHCEIVLHKWITFSGLNLSLTGEEFCSECFSRVFRSFCEKCEIVCCSYSASLESCTCSELCSTMILIFRFLKFCITEFAHPLGECSKTECCGFSECDLKIVALQTFANLAITRNLRCLGLATDEAEILSDNDNTEGDLVRIPVEDGRLQEIVSKHKNEVINFLKNKTGVKIVDIDTEEDKRGRWHLLFRSVGRSWQIRNFEELVLNKNLIQILESAIVCN